MKNYQRILLTIVGFTQLVSYANDDSDLGTLQTLIQFEGVLNEIVFDYYGFNDRWYGITIYRL